MYKKFMETTDSFRPHNRVHLTGYFWHRRVSLEQEIKEDDLETRKKCKTMQSSPMLRDGFITEVKDNGKKKKKGKEQTEGKEIKMNWTKVKSRYLA